jgi:NAD(P)-dependent dehydrogenase (short-subunit alcohol dehydrogenase family)
LEVNLFGVYLVIKHTLPLLKEGRFSRIINFAGGGAFSPFANYSAYACSKTAVVRLTECLADELLPAGVRINSLAPGFIATEMHAATLAAGEERAGRTQYRRTRAILEQGDVPMENMVDCVRTLISPFMDRLSGKTISSNFDPWQTNTFRDYVDEISRSDLYTLRRINIVNLPEGRLRSTLSHPWVDSAPKEP